MNGTWELSGYETLLVNLHGGPGAGKTTLAHELTADLSKAGVLTEYVPERAKELVWEGRRDLLDGTVGNQELVTGEQWSRISRLLGKVEAIVTDSPIELGAIYAREDDPLYSGFVRRLEARMRACNVLDVRVLRGDECDRRGRRHTLEQSIEIDRRIAAMLFGRPVLEYVRGDGRGNYGDVLGRVTARVESLRRERARRLQSWIFYGAREGIDEMIGALSEADRNDGFGDVVLDGQGDEGDARSVAGFKRKLAETRTSLDAVAEECAAKDFELGRYREYCVESLMPEDMAEMEAGEGLLYGDVMSESEIQLATTIAVDRYRGYVDEGDARHDFASEASKEVVGAGELEKRIEAELAKRRAGERKA